MIVVVKLTRCLNTHERTTIKNKPKGRKIKKNPLYICGKISSLPPAASPFLYKFAVDCRTLRVGLLVHLMSSSLLLLETWQEEEDPFSEYSESTIWRNKKRK